MRAPFNRMRCMCACVRLCVLVCACVHLQGEIPSQRTHMHLTCSHTCTSLALRIEIRHFLDFVYNAPRKRTVLLPPRPTSAATNQSQVLRDKAKDPFKIEPAWERELLSVFRRCCCERSLTGVCVCMLVRGGGGEPLGVYYSHIYVCIYIHMYVYVHLCMLPRRLFD